jgi:hypothetical protein
MLYIYSHEDALQSMLLVFPEVVDEDPATQCDS